MNRAELSLAFKWAMRELRWGLSGFRIFLACLILGVGAIASVKSVSTAFFEAIQTEARTLLGGDVALRQIQRPSTPEAVAFLAEWGKVSRVAELRAMARAPSTDGRTIIELKAVDKAYPLFGTVETDQSTPLSTNLAAQETGLPGAIIDPLLAERLEISNGDELRIGTQSFVVRALLEREPDGAATSFTLGPRVIIADEFLDQTGLIQPGSQVRFTYRLALTEDSDEGIAAFKEAAETAHPDEAWRISDRSGAAPQLRGFIVRIAVFLTFTGLTALIVGGVGVGNGVRAYFDRKRNTIATLKCLGAGPNLVTTVYLMQILAFALLGIVVGVAIGAAAPFLIAGGLGALLPVPIEPRLYPMALGEASLYGVLVALIFTLWPLAKAQALPPAALFRDQVAHTPMKSGRRFIWAILALATLLAGAAILFTRFHMFAAVFIAGTLVAFAVLYGLGIWLVQATRKLPRSKRLTLRLAASNLHRPGAPTALIVLSLGLGFTLLSGLTLLDRNIRHQVGTALPKEMPSFFMIDIQKSQRQQLEALLSEQEGVKDLVLVPNIRGRITKVNETPAAEVTPDADVAWVLRGDQGLTYTDEVPNGSTLVEGDWWQEGYEGPPLISLYEGAARGLGLSVGDTLTLNILGREMTSRIANLREIDWSYPGFNFVIIFSPGALDAAPHTYAANMSAVPEHERAIFRAVTDAFPNISLVRTREALQSISNLLDQLAFGVRATSMIALIAGAFVLAGALAAGYRARVYDSVILKVLGATRKQVLAAYLVEFALLGAITGAFAIGLGALISYLIMTFVMEAPWQFMSGPVLATLALSILLTASLGLAATARALGEKPAQVLRTL